MRKDMTTYNAMETAKEHLNNVMALYRQRVKCMKEVMAMCLAGGMWQCFIYSSDERNGSSSLCSLR